MIHHLKKQKKAGIILKLDFEKAYDKVDLTFLEEVLKLKNFDSRWIEWMERVVEGGRVSVNLNGQRGKFFRSYKGLRHGGPLSPMLFNLIGDALAEILKTARDKKVLHGLVPDSVEGGLTHLQYADDTILFLENTEIEIRNTKFPLFCYEEMSGMRINYAKSEVFTVGIGDREGDDIAKVLSKEEMSEPVRKVEKRPETWKCSQLSYGGKAVLINSSLTSIPMYMMGFYMLHEGTHQQMDSIRGRFFWQGVGNKKKFHMVRWEHLTKPKEFGGLGFLETRTMNKVLLAKWIARLDRGRTVKYLGEKNFMQQKHIRGASQFWQGLWKVEDWYEGPFVHASSCGKTAALFFIPRSQRLTTRLRLATQLASLPPPPPGLRIALPRTCRRRPQPPHRRSPLSVSTTHTPLPSPRAEPLCAERRRRRRPNCRGGAGRPCEQGDDLALLKAACERRPVAPSTSFSAFTLLFGMARVTWPEEQTNFFITALVDECRAGNRTSTTLNKTGKDNVEKKIAHVFKRIRLERMEPVNIGPSEDGGHEGG
ncbi:hypothetical protein U9M48_034848 [Paspalum notatum var. saurae]|uniref:Reverse transcriptase domain-containing protein n=1 Tax=Paspalum notatum var. saurae TaxID=547442 RepID=A0AAQ3UBS3_PASNO